MISLRIRFQFWIIWFIVASHGVFGRNTSWTKDSLMSLAFLGQRTNLNSWSTCLKRVKHCLTAHRINDKTWNHKLRIALDCIENWKRIHETKPTEITCTLVQQNGLCKEVSFLRPLGGYYPNFRITPSTSSPDKLITHLIAHRRGCWMWGGGCWMLLLQYFRVF